MALLPFHRCFFIDEKVNHLQLPLKIDGVSMSLKEDTPQNSF